MFRKLIFILLCVVVLSSIAACGSGQSKSNGKQGAKEVVMKNYDFDPAVIEINKGDTVKWINKDKMAHSLTSSTFKSGNIPKGEEYQFTFNEAGEFEYTDVYFPDKKCKVIVK